MVSCCVLVLCSCKRETASQQNNSAHDLPVSTTPPFATREPPRYRAVRTITSFESGSDTPRVSKTVITRDGPRRREESESVNGQKIIYIETPGGAFILAPSAKVMTMTSQRPTASDFPQAVDVEPSADRLLNEVSVETKYQKLGSEILNGRQATKYRVLVSSQTTGTAPVSETLIWVDDTLEMPVRWETRRTSDGGQLQTTMELTDISLGAESRSFELPTDYRKVELAELLNLIRGRKP
jgi:outer membrane lipoprotein-sorting protein